MEPEYQDGDLRSKLLLLFAVTTGTLVAIYHRELFALAIQYVFTSTGTLHEMVKVTKVRYVYFWIISTIIYWLIAYYFYGVSQRINQSQQWPPPGMRAPFRTRIYRGDGVNKYRNLSTFVLWVFIMGPFLNLGVTIYQVKKLSEDPGIQIYEFMVKELNKRQQQP